MVSTHDIYPPASGGFLKPNVDISDDTEVTITGYEVRNAFDKNWIVLRFAGIEKTLRLNVMNAAKIEAAYGDEADEWTGKKLILYPDMVKHPQGGMVPGICVRIPKSFQTGGSPGRLKPIKPDIDERNPPEDDDSY